MVCAVRPGARRIGTVTLAIVALAALGLAATVGPSLAANPRSTVAPAPLRVSHASLSQTGQDLVWSVTLSRPFSLAGLQAQRRSLCLVLKRYSTRAASGTLCLRRGRHANEAAYRTASAAGQGTETVIAATLARAGPDNSTVHVPALGGGDHLCADALAGLSTVASTQARFPVVPGVSRLHVPVVAGCVASGPSLVYAGPSDQREIALTFDDGPWPTPPSMDFVNLLAQYHVPASFFEIGDQISTYDPTGAVERAMLANGDMIGDHTWTHPDMAALPAAEQRSELVQTIDAIRQATGFTPCLWRPPYGDISPSLIALARSLGLVTVMWNDDPRDWSLPGVGAIEQTAASEAQNGGIVEMHFGGGPRYETLEALPTIIDRLRAEGYRFVNVAQLLGLQLIYK